MRRTGRSPRQMAALRGYAGLRWPTLAYAGSDVLCDVTTVAPGLVGRLTRGVTLEIRQGFGGSHSQIETSNDECRAEPAIS